ncbi:acyl-CoA thioesterase [Amycolatopsis sp. OK19-0408]|uniref:Acyl-CoA thioesterase n=1 Tax=Amycolatopsis iheyensis TaxID=2945988 RepID=A0A9X2SN37_9PSEU|nr:acyl-CoA thioesterase [Amycolatopsis iheyensis]MCR6487733.1 acyl-CoA thioesterase [Amycolatopsis iheyensis]
MTEREPFRTRIKVRHYELDTLGHLNHAVYHSYGEVSRLELLEAAGALKGLGNVASVLLETNVVFRRELRAGDEVDVTCDVKFGTGKTFKMDSTITKLDGTVAAEISCTLGMMDLELRKLVPNPRGVFEAAGADLRMLSTSE